MSLDKLLKEDKIEPIVKKFFDLSLVERDLKAARDNLDSQNYDWSLSISYNAVLQAGRALMFSAGYRPKGKDQHKIIFEFLSEIEIDQRLFFYFDKIRKIKHTAIYDQAEIVSKEAAEETRQKAEEFIEKIKFFQNNLTTSKSRKEEKDSKKT